MNVKHCNLVAVIGGEYAGSNGELIKIAYDNEYYLINLRFPQNFKDKTIKYLKIDNLNNTQAFKFLGGKDYLVNYGEHAGIIGELKSASKPVNALLNIHNRNVTVDYKDIFYKDIVYESPKNNGFIEIISISNNMIDGKFLSGDLSNVNLSNVNLSIDDKYIKKQCYLLTSDESDLNTVSEDVDMTDEQVDTTDEPETTEDYDDDESSEDHDTSEDHEITDDNETSDQGTSEDSEMSDDSNFVSEHDALSRAEYDMSKMTQDDQKVYNLIQTFVEKLRLNGSLINPYTIINYFNFIIKEMKSLQKKIISDDDKKVLLFIIIIYEYTKNNGILNDKYTNILKIGLNNKFNDKSSVFNKLNFTKIFGIEETSSNTFKNANRYIKQKFPFFMFDLENLQANKDETMKNLVPVSSAPVKVDKPELVSYKSDIQRKEIYDDIEKLKIKLKEANASNKIQLSAKLQNDISNLESKLNKSVKTTTTTTSVEQYNSFDDYYHAFVNHLKELSQKGDKKRFYEIIINNFTNMNLENNELKEYQNKFKEYYLNAIYIPNLSREKSDKLKLFKKPTALGYVNWYKKHFINDDQINMASFDAHFNQKMEKMRKLTDIYKEKERSDAEREAYLGLRKMAI